MAGLRLPRTYREVGYYSILGLFGLFAVLYVGASVWLAFLVSGILWVEAVVGFYYNFSEDRKSKNLANREELPY